MKSNALMVACAVALALVVASYAMVVRDGMHAQEQRRECMAALHTPGVEDPEYDQKAVEFTEGIEGCLTETGQE